MRASEGYFGDPAHAGILLNLLYVILNLRCHESLLIFGKSSWSMIDAAYSIREHKKKTNREGS
jgi:hypothetical protein